jgi:hypothetical protein
MRLEELGMKLLEKFDPNKIKEEKIGCCDSELENDDEIIDINIVEKDSEKKKLKINDIKLENLN